MKYIVDPNNFIKYRITTKQGRQVLIKYIKTFQNGGGTIRKDPATFPSAGLESFTSNEFEKKSDQKNSKDLNTTTENLQQTLKNKEKDIDKIMIEFYNIGEIKDNPKLKLDDFGDILSEYDTFVPEKMPEFELYYKSNPLEYEEMDIDKLLANKTLIEGLPNITKKQNSEFIKRVADQHNLETKKHMEMVNLLYKYEDEFEEPNNDNNKSYEIKL